MISFIVAMVLQGTLGIFVAEAKLDSVTIVFFRCAFGSLVLAAYCAWKGFFVPANFQTKNVLLAVFSGVLMVTNWIAFFEAIHRIGISVSTIVFHVQPFLVLLIGALIFRERTALAKIVWIGIGFCGLVLATGLHIGEMHMVADYATGIGYALFSALMYAGVTLTTKAMHGMRPHLTALIHCLVGILLLAFWISLSTLNISRVQWGWLAGVGMIHTALAYVLIYGALPKLKAGSIAVLTFIYPASAIGFDFLIYGHTLNLRQEVGLDLIVLAGLGVNVNWAGLGVASKLRDGINILKKVPVQILVRLNLRSSEIKR